MSPFNRLLGALGVAEHFTAEQVPPSSQQAPHTPSTSACACCLPGGIPLSVQSGRSLGAKRPVFTAARQFSPACRSHVSLQPESHGMGCVLTVVLGWGAMGLRRSQSLPACGSEKHLQGLLRRHNVDPGRLSCPGCTNAHGTGMRVAVHGGPGCHGGGLWGGAAAGRVPGAGRGNRAGLSCFFGPSLALDLCLCASLGWLLASCRSADTVAGAEAAP